MQPEQDSDGRIRDALSRDDPVALDWIWEAYAARLLAFASAILCSHHDAEETLQNVFLKIARNRDRLADAVSLKAYLFTMTRNEACTLIRKRGRREVSVDPRDLWLVPAGNPEPGLPEDAEAAAQRLATLPVRQRDVIVLKVFREMTFDDIAGALDISPNTAASRYRYGMDKLKRRMNRGRP
ncbi:MAG TPA: RNA polymerase sigma factor [Kiritimatiellia bacterium]|nr:RNA polymerase sigma factor [Kiritimatiellia bacterium]HRZ12790.1 RNA polymerase sigma factor [Kiritimatiellia bacterium]HSA18258.1 RNA polymerase sigma factor [Kiritimatiellia bacterium]